MTRPKNPQPAQIPHRLVSPGSRPINRITTHRFRLKHALSTICYGVRDSEPAKPVADPVCVASPDERCDS
jgi:hypothetical protein